MNNNNLLKLTVATFLLAPMIFTKSVYAENKVKTTKQESEYRQESETGFGINSQTIKDSKISPEKLKTFQDNERIIQKENTTVSKLYEDIQFARFRSIEAGFIASSGSSGEQQHFKSVTGFSLGANIEFPIAYNYLKGGTPLAKVRIGKTTIGILDESEAAAGLAGDDDEVFTDSLGNSELYMLGVGAGYCYHTGFNCAYVMYNNSFTGQLSQAEGSTIFAIPTKLKGVSVGVSSTFEVGLGFELSAGIEYSLMQHLIPGEENHEFNTLGVNLALGFVDDSRYKRSPKVEFYDAK